MADENKEYVSLRRLSAFLNKLKELFITKEEAQKALDEKSQVQIVTWEADD